MQTITTLYKAGASGQGRVQVKSQYGTKRVLWDDALNSEQNHRAAVVATLDQINAARGTRFTIVNSAPHHADNGGWVFLINQAPEIAPCYMSITVRFMPGTNTRPAYMKVHSWVFPKGTTVNYSRETAPGDVQGAAFYAARVMLDMINDEVKDAGISYSLGDYIQTYDQDRVFSLR
jgi:hypothetical protein